ncbi:carboxylic ester hydrolase [Favolaschia claudopus]|uniref:Carboxylic ester hydrolase n=1 Tax=Favolaschia claudopus TaxID=2862362 RepID=A0AAW0DXB2_9AGAR
MLCLFLSLFCSLGPASAELAHAAPTVALDYGTFRGKFDGNLSTFLGVPFARPVVRFTTPKLPTKLQGIQDVTKFSPACPQQFLPAPFPLPPFPVPPMSEDCLKLNIFVPTSTEPHSKLPVLFWIFGGGFEIGNAPDTEMRPLVERSILNGEPIIVVTPNYRVSAWGFLAGKEADTAGISNLGLQDQIFALEWVHRQIAAFGGDPNRVVIGGPSAGAISAALLLLPNKRFNPTSLFRGAFLLSGSPPTASTVADGQPAYNELVTANNCTEAKDTLECLRRIPFDDFKATVDNTTNLFSFTSVQNVWRPRVDGNLIIQNPLLSVAQGKTAKVAVITGDADDEGTVFALSSANITTSDEFVGYVQSIFFPKATPAEIAHLAALYPNDPTQGSPFDTGLANQLTPQFKRMAAFQGDYQFIGARRFLLEHISKRQNVWSWVTKRAKDTPIIGAAHGSDVPIWFPTEITNSTDFVPVDALINFINTLDPNHSAGTHRKPAAVFWPRWNNLISDGSPSLLTLTDPAGINITSENFRVEAIQFLNNLLLKEAEVTA